MSPIGGPRSRAAWQRRLDVEQRLIVSPCRRHFARMVDRRYPAHPAVIDWVGIPTIVFVTVCTARKRPVLANASAVAALQAAWRKADAWIVGRYVVMPDHVHLFCAPLNGTPLTTWVRFWKSLATRGWPRPVPRPLWQKDCWDTQLRTASSYDEKWEYVRWNPVRNGLVQLPDRWPFQGEFARLEWI